MYLRKCARKKDTFWIFYGDFKNAECLIYNNEVSWQVPIEPDVVSP